MKYMSQYGFHLNPILELSGAKLNYLDFSQKLNIAPNSKINYIITMRAKSFKGHFLFFRISKLIGIYYYKVEIVLMFISDITH